MGHRAALLVMALIGMTACGAQPTARPSLDGTVVDADPPRFSDPTRISNPLFPVSELAQVIQLGVDGGQPLRVEVTLMPETRTISWRGEQIETVVAQFIAYRERRVVEVAYDFFAQADDGSVWYFGETVDNYGGGQVTNHSGAWLAGVDGPPGMIMPASPEVGDIYHPENIPGVVFEELIVLETGITVDGPSGPITGVIKVEEHLMDGGVEQKLWAPGYGEYRTETVGELLTAAVASPTDAVPGGVPDPILGIRRAAVELADAAATGDATPEAWLQTIRTGWDAHRDEAPMLLAQEMDAALAELDRAAAAGDRLVLRQAAIDVLQVALDLELRYRAPSSIDLHRLSAWMRQLALDVDATDRPAVLGDVAIASVIWARAGHALDGDSTREIEARLASAAAAAGEGDMPQGRRAAEGLMTVLDSHSG